MKMTKNADEICSVSTVQKDVNASATRRSLLRDKRHSKRSTTTMPQLSLEKCHHSMTSNKKYYYYSLLFTALTFAVDRSAAIAPPVAKEAVKSESVALSPNTVEFSVAEAAQICAEFPAMSSCQTEQQRQVMEKRKSAYMRFGRSVGAPLFAPQLMDDETAAYANAMEKRKSAYMRFGKRFTPYDTFDYEQMYGPPVVKRKSAYMRFGKRSGVGEMEKRKSAYMRFGRR